MLVCGLALPRGLKPLALFAADFGDVNVAATSEQKPKLLGAKAGTSPSDDGPGFTICKLSKNADFVFQLLYQFLGYFRGGAFDFLGLLALLRDVEFLDFLQVFAESLFDFSE